jgi:hypothetical protein
MAKLKTARIRWNDETWAQMSVTVCLLETKEEYLYVCKTIEEGTNAEFLDFDSNVWFYFDVWDENEPISRYYKKQNGNDWHLLELSEDFDEVKIGDK